MSDLVPAVPPLEGRIHRVRGLRVMLDADLAELYGVETFNLNKAVKRNRERFPADFMFQLTAEENERLRSQIATSNLIFQTGISRPGHGGRRHLPYVFTEQGVAMLSSVLRSKRAVAVNIGIMRAFVRMRLLLGSNADLARKVAELEKKSDVRFRVIVRALKKLMMPEPPTRPRIGFKALPEGEAGSTKGRARR